MNILLLTFFGIFVTRASVAANPAAKSGSRPPRPSKPARKGFPRVSVGQRRARAGPERRRHGPSSGAAGRRRSALDVNSRSRWGSARPRDALVAASTGRALGPAARRRSGFDPPLAPPNAQAARRPRNTRNAIGSEVRPVWGNVVHEGGNRMKGIIKLTIAAAAAIAAVGGAATTVLAQTPHIIVVSHGQANDPFWSVVKNGVVQGAKDMGVSVDYRAPETFDMVAMSQLIDAAVNQKPSGLIVSIPDASALSPSIKKAVA